jgi:alpha-tubulin suppressor-like RCC1 family protein
VTWGSLTGAGTVEPIDVSTNADGIVRSNYRLGTMPGENVVRASINPLGLSVDFPATARGFGDQIAVAPAYTCALDELGIAYCWGYNSVGQLGDGTTTDRVSPIWLKLMPGKYAYHQLSAGSLHSLAVTVNAGMGSTGWNGLRQVNMGTEDWAEFGAALPGFTHGASAGWYHSLVLYTNGSVRSSGWNVVGQLGDGSTVTRGWAPVPGLTGVWALSAGGLHSLALKDDGSLVAWGWNVVGQLGTGSTVDARSPVTVDSSGHVATVSAGYLHSVAVKR